jgi:hypothetical protein
MSNPRARRGRSIRFTDAEWDELQQGAQAIGETRSEAIRAGAMSRVRQSIPDASDVTPRAWPSIADEARRLVLPGEWTSHKAGDLAVSIAAPARADIDGMSMDDLKRLSRQPNGRPDAAPRPPDAAWEDVARDYREGRGIAGHYPPDCPAGDLSKRQIFACAYCPAEFCTSFDAEAHIDTMHGDQQ